MLQGLWARTRGVPLADRAFKNGATGVRKLAPLCNHVDLEYARREGSNFLTEGIRRVVVDELMANAARSRADRKEFREDRLYGDLLSSQALAFNLFGELKLDLDLATRIFRYLRPEQVGSVTRIEFEHSPGREDEHGMGGRCTFAVFVEYTGTRGPGFIGIEAKYTETMTNKPFPFSPRYRDIAEASGQFKPDALEVLCSMPPGSEQLWRQHLLSLSLCPPVSNTYTHGCSMFIYPQDNFECQIAVNRYHKALSSWGTFVPLTMEEYCWALRSVKAGPWVDELLARYLAFSSIRSLVSPIESRC